MANSNALVLWVLGGAGTLLLYAAVKNQHPKDVLMNSLHVTENSGAASPIAPAPKQSDPGQWGGAGGTFSTSGYWKGTDKYGENLLYSASGQIIGTVPPNYVGSPGTYIMNA